MNRIAECKTETNSHFVAFDNKVVNIHTLEELEHNPNFIFTNKINWDYKRDNSSNELVDKFFTDISNNNNEIIDMLTELIGYCFLRSNHFHKCFFLLGNGANGKSTFLTIINTIFNDSASNLSLKELTENKFSTSSLYTKNVNIADDESNLKVLDTGLLKKIISGEKISAEFKGKDKFEFVPFATIIVSLNGEIIFKDKSNGLQRRIVCIPFENIFSKRK